MRIWLMKITTVLVLEMMPVSLRRAWLINLACRPICESPMSPSISFCGTSAATESTTTTSTALERTKVSKISKACSPVSGWLINNSLMLMPMREAYSGSRACSASIKAAMPPNFCTSLMTCWARVVLPEASGPKISITRPRGTPLMPRAMSKDRQPVGTASTSALTVSPNFMMAPSPNLVLICSTAD